MHPFILAAALAGQFVLAPQTPPPNPNPTPQASAAVPTPQGWGPPPAAAAAAAAAPATFPLQPTAPAAPLYSIVLQAVPPPPAAFPVFAPASSQFSPQAAPYVNPFVVTQQQAPQPQQGIGAIALTAGVTLVDNPWIFDRIAAHIGEHLVKRGVPRIIIPPPGSPAIPTVPTAPAGSSAPVYLATPSGAIQAVPVAHHRTAFARWFWGE